MRLPWVKGLLIVGATLAGSLIAEWIVARAVAGSIVVPPMTTFAVILTMQALPFPLALVLALGAGFFFDSISLPPFGAAIALFLFLACVMEIGRALIADRTSRIVRFAMAAGLYFLAYGVAPLARSAAAFLNTLS